MNSQIIADMFTLGLPILEKILRPIIVYIALIVGLRLAGKRELAQLNTFDLVVLLTLSNTVQNAIIGNDNSVSGGLIGAATLLVVNYVVVRFVYGNGKIEALVEGTEDVLIENGLVNPQALKRNMISLQELEIAAHRQGFNSLDEIERATLEPEGGVAFISRRPQPEEARHLELLARLDQMAGQISALQTEISSRDRGPSA